MELSVLDLFSGIGGFSVGLESTNKFKTVAFCEQDKFCQKVLQKHWKDIPIHEDIKKLDGTKIKADVVVGGFPCQSFSIAGKQKGKDDERYLWDEMFRVIKEVKPRWIIGENVQNLTNISNGEILQGIYNDLESQGYEIQTFNISASSQGAWHKRSRIWIVAANTKCKLLHGCSSTTTDSTKKFTGLECNKGEVRGKIWSKTERCSEQNLQFTNTNKFGTQIQAQGEHTSFKMSGSTSKKSWWQTQSELCGVPHGLQYESHPDRANRIKALGNSIVPQIVTEIGKAIIKAEEEINEWN
jgi:DNA (cytosine-5)-methyltransferase 1